MIIRNQKEILEVKSKYKAGMKIRLISMDDMYSKLKPGDEGTVTYVDDIGTIHMRWNNGSSLGLIEGEDKFEVLTAMEA